MVDVLTDVLTVTRMHGTRLDQLVAASPWAVRLPDSPHAAFHAVAQGTCWLTVPGRPAVQLVAGDVALLPAGASHVLSSSPGIAVRDHADLVAEHGSGRGAIGGRLDLPGPGQQVHLLCGGYTYLHDGVHPVLRLLPAVVHLPAHAGADTGIPPVLAMLATELAEQQPGAQSVVDHLVDVLFVHILRAWDSREGEGSHWLRALRDPAVAAALSRMHNEPARPWTVGELASTAGLSRAAFARRFTELVGEPPLAYLTRWRMDLAARRLRLVDQPVAAVARAVGYTSEYAFSRAFNRSRGLPPARYRSQARADEPSRTAQTPPRPP